MLKGFITNLGKYNEGQLKGKWIMQITPDFMEMTLTKLFTNT